MSSLSRELFESAQIIQTAGTNPRAAQLFALAASQENADDAYEALSKDAATVADIATITTSVAAQTRRLAASIASSQRLVTIGTQLLTVIGGAADPLAVAPTLASIVRELASP